MPEERKQAAMMTEFKTEVSDGDPESATRRQMAAAEAGGPRRSGSYERDLPAGGDQRSQRYRTFSTSAFSTA